MVDYTGGPWRVRFEVLFTSQISFQTTDFHFANYRFSFRKLQIFISQTTDSHFANYRFSFRKVQILVSQSTDFHFANYRFPFRFVPFRFANYSKPSFTYKKSHSFQPCTPFTTYLFYRRYISYSHCSTCHLPP